MHSLNHSLNHLNRFSKRHSKLWLNTLQIKYSTRLQESIFKKDAVQLNSSKHQSSILTYNHPWIYNHSVKHVYPNDNGEIRDVLDSNGNFLGKAYFNSKCTIYGRFLYRNDKPLDIEQVLVQKLQNAIHLRTRYRLNTNCYRIVHADADGLPGLIVDKYNNVLVLQIQTMGMELLKPFIVEQLKNLLPDISLIIEKTNSQTRKIEGLPSGESTIHVLHGDWKDDVLVFENGMKFMISLKDSQKTGFFLDQREMRNWCRQNCKSMNVLNCFSYTGGFTVAAFYGGAKSVDSVEISTKALSMLTKNLSLNKFEKCNHREFPIDVFAFLEKEPLEKYDFIILDPPAFVKTKTLLDKGVKGYLSLHKRVFQGVKPGTLVMTSSCSYYVNESLFRNIILKAAVQTKRNVKILGKHIWAPDHPVDLYCPETEYIKSFILYIDS